MRSVSPLLKNFLKKVLPYRQSLAVYHYLHNRRTLTVVTFHRVLRPTDPRWAGALKEWTVSDSVFEECLLFFRRHYNLVGLHDLLACLRGDRQLPPRSLLVTFDDGYADNAEYALPLLLRHRIPAVLFVSSAFVNSCSRPWTEDLLAAYEKGRVSRGEIAQLHRALFQTKESESSDASAMLWDMCARRPALADAEVETLCAGVLRQPLERLKSPPQMLTGEQIKSMHAAGIAIGAHGQTHSSMPRSADLDAELRHPQAMLSKLLGLPPLEPINVLAFPYGEYSQAVVTGALQAGYKLLFAISTHSPRLNPLPHGRLASPVLDRINVGQAVSPDGATTPERLAKYFFRRPVALRL